MKIKILVATHKPYWMPQDPIYMPLHVGKAGKLSLGYFGDDEGDSISEKNKNFCELTGLYWAWKNLETEYIGLCHYRRYFGIPCGGDLPEERARKIFQKADYELLLEKYDVILPRRRRYYIETVRSQYEHAHYKRDLDEVEKIIGERFPEYIYAFRSVMNRRSLYIFNMFVMKQEQFHAYCSWLFSILFKLEERIDISKYDVYQARVFGFLSERLFNVWLEQQQLKYIEVPVVSLEKVNWPKKIKEFLVRKFG